MKERRRLPSLADRACKGSIVEVMEEAFGALSFSLGVAGVVREMEID